MSSAQLVASNGGNHKVFLAGEKGSPAVLLLHGFPSRAILWERQVTKGRDFDLITGARNSKNVLVALVKASLVPLCGSGKSNTECTQMPVLASAGYLAIAPDLRGAVGGGSPVPEKSEDCSIPDVIVKDLAGGPVCQCPSRQLSFKCSFRELPPKIYAAFARLAKLWMHT